MANPFRPSFGVNPPLLAGRDAEILAFGDALDQGPGAPGRATIYTGLRGVGKTVMLNEAEAQARQRGWVVVSETSVPGLVQRLVSNRLPEVAANLEMHRQGTRLTAINLPFHLGGLTWQPPTSTSEGPDLRAQLTALTDHLAEHGTGLLITVDELHQSDRAGMRELAATLQHCLREERPVAFAGAGLPTAVADLLNDDVLTFLRRADRHQLGAVDNADVADALARTTGEHWTRHHRRRSAGRCHRHQRISLPDPAGRLLDLQTRRHRRGWICPDRRGDRCPRGQRGPRRLGSLIHEPALRDLSHVDRTFLAAMASDDGSSWMPDIAARLGVDKSYASQYRLRLIAADMIPHRPRLRRLQPAVPAGLPP